MAHFSLRFISNVRLFLPSTENLICPVVEVAFQFIPQRNIIVTPNMFYFSMCCKFCVLSTYSFRSCRPLCLLSYRYMANCLTQTRIDTDMSGVCKNGLQWSDKSLYISRELFTNISTFDYINHLSSMNTIWTCPIL